MKWDLSSEDHCKASAISCTAQTTQWVTFPLCLRLGRDLFVQREELVTTHLCTQGQGKDHKVGQQWSLTGTTETRWWALPGWEEGSDIQLWPLVQGQDAEEGFLAELLMIRGCWGCGELLPHLLSDPFLLKCQGGGTRDSIP